MIFSDEVKQKLLEPLDMSIVKTRAAGGNRQVSYMPTVAIKSKANEIFGPGEWSYTISQLHFIGEQEVERWRDSSDHSKGKDEGWRVAYYAVVRLTVGDTVYEDVGFGDDTDYNSGLAPHELAVKESVTDALKRCFMNFGAPFGLPLWDKDSEENRQAVGSARKGGGGGARQTQQRAPATATEGQRRAILARATEGEFTEEQRHRIIAFATGGATRSTKTLLASDVKHVLDALAFVAEHADTAWADIETWEQQQTPTRTAGEYGDGYEG